MRMTLAMPRMIRPAAVLALPLVLLGGCISLGGEPPASLLTLSPATSAPTMPSGMVRARMSGAVHTTPLSNRVG